LVSFEDCFKIESILWKIFPGLTYEKNDFFFQDSSNKDCMNFSPPFSTGKSVRDVIEVIVSAISFLFTSPRSL
jgi:hypothetical protein